MREGGGGGVGLGEIISHWSYQSLFDGLNIFNVYLFICDQLNVHLQIHLHCNMQINTQFAIHIMIINK